MGQLSDLTKVMHNKSLMVWELKCSSKPQLPVFSSILVGPLMMAVYNCIYW